MSGVAATVGERLMAERELKGLSTQKAADELHLDAWVIEALESGDYVRIGPSVYGKGHLKRYAALLGLPVEEIVALYEARSRPQPEPSQASAPRLQSAQRPLPILSSRTVVMAGIVVAIAVVGAALMVWHRVRPPAGMPVAADAAADTAASHPAAPDDGLWFGDATLDSERDLVGRSPADRPGNDAAAARVVNAQAPGGSSAPARGKHAIGAAAPGVAVSAVAAPAVHGVVRAAMPGAAAAGVGRARLRLSFSADSWVVVRDADGRRLFAGNGRANSVKTIAGAAPMRVFLGFASGVQLEVNNHALAIGPQFLAGDEARFEAGADGVLRHDAHPAAPANPHPRG